jgi:hypothetical protein
VSSLLSLPLAGGADPLLSGDPLDRPDRNLLIRGNTKLGEDVCHFDLPAKTTCPGRSPNCSGLVKLSPKTKGSRRCYVLQLYLRHPAVKVGHQRNLRAARRLDALVQRIVREIRRRHLRTVRPHVSGDFFSVAYALAWLQIMRSCPDTQFFFYSRSWRIPTICAVLEQMAELPNVAVWYSVDGSTGLPESWPARVRLAWMALHVGEGEPWACAEQIARCHLVLLDHPLRRLELKTFGGVGVCPQERDATVTCTSCRHCMPGAIPD